MDFKTSHSLACDVSELAETPCVSAGCDVVTVSDPLPDDDNVILFEERAAMREYDGCLSRPEAERLARAELGSS